MWHADLDHVLEKRTLKEMRQIFDANGIKYIELEFLTDWFLDGERKKQSDTRRKKLLEAAEVLGAKHVKVGDFNREKCSMSQVTDAFAALCAKGAKHGTKIGFELMPFAMIDTLRESITMVREAGAPNGGVVLDL